MRTRKGWRRLHAATAKYVSVGSVLAVLFVTASELPEEHAAQLWYPLQWASTWLKGHAFPWLPLLVFSVPAVELVKRGIGAPWIWEAVEVGLRGFAGQAFEHLGKRQQHHHRVTLFKFVGPRWYPSIGFCRNWLVPYARSSRGTKHTKTVFRVPDDRDKAEGFAGEIFNQEESLMVSGLPDIGTGATEEAYQNYAERTGVSVEWLREHQPRARSFAGFPIEVNDDLWGVVVLDSRDPAALDPNQYNILRHAQAALAEQLSSLLRRV